MIGELRGDPLAVLAGAREILAGISPLGTVRLVARDLVFETRRPGDAPWIEHLPARDGLSREEVRHLAIRSWTAAMPAAWSTRSIVPDGVG